MNNKIALVTGGTGGIGTATCLMLSRAGFRTVAVDHPSRESELQYWRAQINEQSPLPVELRFADVGDFASCATMAADLAHTMGPVSVLVNAAGITRDATLRNMEQHQWDQVMRTDLDSVFYVTRQFIEPMIDQGYGRIINVSSVNGRKGQFGQTNYSAAKAGVHGFTKALAQEVAGKGITVNTVSPGYVATPMVMAIREEVREQIISGIPLGRLAEPDEIARVISFLADEQSAYITGANIDINGGMWMH